MRGERQSLFNTSEEPPILHYVTPDGEVHACSLDSAHLWLQAGYFTSRSKFIFTSRDVDGLSGEWKVWTLNDLIERNGRAMPFLMYDKQNSKKEVETLRGFREEMAVLNKRRLNVLGTIRSLQDRHLSVQYETLCLGEIVDSMPVPSSFEEILPPIESVHITKSPPSRVSSQCSHPIPPMNSSLNSDQFVKRTFKCPLTLSEDEENGEDNEEPLVESSNVPELENHPIDFSLMGNPFAEISHPGDVKEVVRKTAAQHILRIDGDTAWSIRAFPVNGIDPFDVLTLVDASAEQVMETVTSYSKKLTDLFARVDGKRFNSFCKNLPQKQNKLRCVICDKPLKNGDASKLIEHIISGPHVDKMRRFNVVYSLEAVVFWMYALRIAQKDAAWWFPDEKKVKKEVIPQKAIVVSKKKKFARLEKIVVSEPNFQEETLLKQLKEQYKKKAQIAAKVGETLRREKQKQNLPCDSEPLLAVSLFDILSANISLIKNPFDEIAHPGGAELVKELQHRTAAKKILRFDANRLLAIDDIDPLGILRPVPVQKGGVEDAVIFYTQKMRELFYSQSHGLFNILVTHLLADKKTHGCELCSSWIPNEKASDLIHHILQQGHVNKMLQANLVYPMEPLAFWMHAVNFTHNTKPTEEWESEEKPAQSSPVDLSKLQSKLMVAARTDPTSPLALLTYFKEVPDPCPDYKYAATFLESKMWQCNINKFNEAMHQYFEKALDCDVCFFESNLIRNGREFIAHITNWNHVQSALRKDGCVSKKALRFWLDALCSAGAATPPGEQRGVIRLFGDR